MDMKIKRIVVVLLAVLLLTTSLSVVAKPSFAPGQLKEKNQKAKEQQPENNQDAPGQWKKIKDYENQHEFVFEIHMRIWERLQQWGVQPKGLERLLGFSDDDGPREEPIEEPVEEPIEPPLLPVEGEPMD
jgi:hypothetical protein